MIRGTFANIRLRNQLAPGTEGGVTRDFTKDGEETTVFEASENYLEQGIPLVVLAGKEYGSGSSRDWAAKGTALLGVKAVIAESYERIHRSNLIGMGVLPLQYPEGETRRVAGPHRRGGVLDHRRHRAQRRDPEDRQGQGDRRRPTTSSSTPRSASTPPARRTTTATAGSCRTCCGACARHDRCAQHQSRLATPLARGHRGSGRAESARSSPRPSGSSEPRACPARPTRCSPTSRASGTR